MTEKTITIKSVLENSETIDKLLELQELKTQLDIVLNSNKDCQISINQVKFNKKYNLPLHSKIGLLLAIGKQIEL